MDIVKMFDETVPYFYEDVRINTYKNWVFDNDAACNVKKMAEAGFIFAGNKREPDAVRCFFCNKHLDGWESTDDPWKEHIKHAPNCTFAKLQKSQNIITLSQAFKLRSNYMIKIGDAHCEDIISDVTNILKKAKTQMKKCA